MGRSKNWTMCGYSLHQAGAEVWTLLPRTPAWDPPLSRASEFCSRLETTEWISYSKDNDVWSLHWRSLQDLQVAGIKKHKLLMRNGDHTAHVTLTGFTILKNPKSLQISSGHSCMEMCKMAHLGQAGAAALHGFSGTCSSSELSVWPRVPIHSRGYQGSRALFPAIPIARCCLWCLF